MGDEQWRLLRGLLDRGVDPDARNAAASLHWSFFFMTGNYELFEDADDYDRFYAIGKDVLSMFEQAGYKYEETNSSEQTLLHVVAGLASDRACPWLNSFKPGGSTLWRKTRKDKRPLRSHKRMRI